jgi:hypothetical protein
MVETEGNNIYNTVIFQPSFKSNKAESFREIESDGPFTFVLIMTSLHLHSSIEI